jgi:spore maturation protein CgeB
MRILFVASLHHPDALQAAVDATPPGQTPPLFPTSTTQHFYEKVLKKRGYTLDVFYRNIPAYGGGVKAQHHQQGITPGKVAAALMNRIPPEINPDYHLRNQHLVEKAREFRPDWLWMVGDNTVIYAQTLAQIKRETGCKIVYATGTSPIVFSRPVERKAARLYDLVLTNDYYHGIQWLELGAKRMECLPISACDPEFHRSYDLSEAERKMYTCDIAFVGTLIPDTLYSQRVHALESLREFNLGIWSVHDAPPSLQAQVRGQALGESMLEVLSAAKITINTHGDFMRFGGNMRLFEAAGVGVLQIADDLPGTRQWFADGETIVLYQDVDDLRAKVTYYLAHEAEREAIVRRAQAHVYRHHTYEQRVNRLEALFEVT